MTTKVVNPSLQLDSAKEMEFLRLSEFNSGETGAVWSNAGGPSPWEMHPDCDELLHIIEGKVEIEILSNDSRDDATYTLTSGSFLVVPQGCWHRQKILEKIKEYYVTPGQTLHSHSDDPRIEVEGT